MRYGSAEQFHEKQKEGRSGKAAPQREATLVSAVHSCYTYKDTKH
jgi:hypothetical protein